MLAIIEAVAMPPDDNGKQLIHHIAQHIIHRHAKLLGTADAKTLADLIAVFQLGNKNHSNALVAS